MEQNSAQRIRPLKLFKMPQCQFCTKMSDLFYFFKNFESVYSQKLSYIHISAAQILQLQTDVRKEIQINKQRNLL